MSIFWDFYATCYDAIALLIPYKELMERVCEELELKPGFKILDAGCGTGTLEVWLDKIEIPNISVEALDFSQAMLNRAEKKCRRLVNAKVNFSYFDLNKRMPFPDDYFDRVVSINVLYTLNDPESAVKELSRVLKNKGKGIFVNPYYKNFLAVFFTHIKEIWGKDKIFDFLLTGAIIPSLLIVCLINIVIVNRASRGKYHFLSTSELKEIIEATGIKIEKAFSCYSNTASFIKSVK
ncbi:methyltransferase domain-containing protein [candidate division WOR-3 bacterium]|nr:methyltransferase domain-containing protein [candidate division WOR-3 bacterium]